MDRASFEQATSVFRKRLTAIKRLLGQLRHLLHALALNRCFSYISRRSSGYPDRPSRGNTDQGVGSGTARYLSAVLGLQVDELEEG